MAPSSQHASSSARPGGPVTQTGGRARAISDRRRWIPRPGPLPPVSLAPCTYRAYGPRCVASRQGSRCHRRSASAHRTCNRYSPACRAVAVRPEHVSRGRGQRGPDHDLDATRSPRYLAPAVTASNMACIAGDGVWCTISSRRMCPQHSGGPARAGVPPPACASRWYRPVRDSGNLSGTSWHDDAVSMIPVAERYGGCRGHGGAG